MEKKRHADTIESRGGQIEFQSVSGLTHYDTRSYATYVGEEVNWLEGQWK